jgi:Ca2+-binding RTX toxin-like protein
VIGGDGNDEFLIVDGTQIDIDGGLGEEYLLVVGGSSITARLDDGNDRATMLAGQGSLIAGGDGNDVMKVIGSLGRTLSAGQVYVLIDGQGGNDQLSVLPLFSVEDPDGVGYDSPLVDVPTWMDGLSAEWTSPTSTRYPSSIALMGA